MLIIYQRLPTCSPHWDEELHFIYEARSKSRPRCFAANDEEVGLFLERSQSPPVDGDCLEVRDDRLVRVVARPERLLHVTCVSPLELTRVIYHLGSRHVALQVDDGWPHLLDGYVLKAILEQLGVTVETIEAPFQPEHGVYGRGHHHSYHGETEFNYAPCLHQLGVC